MGSDVPDAVADEADAEPWVGNTVPMDVRRKLVSAFPISLGRVRQHTACRDLFNNLGTTGPAALKGTYYYVASIGQERKFCRRADAITQVGSRVTILCRRFSQLSPDQAAVVLIHEALHLAGMGEKPMERSALNSNEINLLVRRRCEL